MTAAFSRLKESDVSFDVINRVFGASCILSTQSETNQAGVNVLAHPSAICTTRWLDKDATGSVSNLDSYPQYLLNAPILTRPEWFPTQLLAQPSFNTTAPVTLVLRWMNAAIGHGPTTLLFGPLSTPTPGRTPILAAALDAKPVLMKDIMVNDTGGRPLFTQQAH